MYSGILKDLSPLDKLRLSSGTEKLKNYFHDMAVQNAGMAIGMLNAGNLLFPSLFALKSEIKKLDIYGHLCMRNRFAFDLIDKIAVREISAVESVVSNHKPLAHIVLKWILKTGYAEENMSTPYDEVLDTAAVLLVKTFNDNSDLATIMDIVFRRYRKGSVLYDLVWSAFESRSPYVLILTAGRLLSNNCRDVELALKLLKFIPCINSCQDIDNINLYMHVSNWINENYQFLYHTGESFQQTCAPRPFVVSLESKYLCKTTLCDMGKTAPPLTRDESMLLDEFSKMDGSTKELLANFSYLLFRSNPDMWKAWIRYPLTEQIRIAKEVSGGSV